MRGGVEVEGFRGREGEGFGRQSVPFRVFPRQRKQETGSSPWHGLLPNLAPIRAMADRDLVVSCCGSLAFGFVAICRGDLGRGRQRGCKTLSDTSTDSYPLKPEGEAQRLRVL